MKVEVKPTEDIDQLAENLRARAKNVRKEKNVLIVETSDTTFLEETPGVEEFEKDGEEIEGIGGKPVSEQAYARLESREDAVKCLLATLEGYDLRILDTEREWDLKHLKKFNPDIKHLKTEEPRDFLGIDYALFDSDDAEKVEVEMPEKDDVIKIYRELLT